MPKTFDIFEEYGGLGSNCQFTLSGNKDWNWFKIYVFTKEEIDLVKELQTLNSLLVKHRMEGFGEFSVCIEHLLLPDRSFGFLSRKKKKKRIKNEPWI